VPCRGLGKLPSPAARLKYRKAPQSFCHAATNRHNRGAHKSQTTSCMVPSRKVCAWLPDTTLSSVRSYWGSQMRIWDLTAVLPKIPHSNSCKRVPNRPLRPRVRPRRGRFGTLLQQVECGIFGRTAVPIWKNTVEKRGPVRDKTQQISYWGPAHLGPFQINLQNSAFSLEETADSAQYE